MNPKVALSLLLSVSITTDHFDNSRTGWNNTEIVLTPASVTSGLFARRGSYAVDGPVYAQPLVMTGITVSGVSRDLLIVATMNCSVYAFDADAPSTSAIWHTNLCTPRSSYPSAGNYFYGGTVGCLATPVSDGSYVYAACVTSAPSVVLYKLSIATGSLATSVAISGTYGGQTFNAAQEMPRTGLTLANSNVYVGFSAYADTSPWFGWIVGYSTSALSQIGIFCTAPSGTKNGGGVWQASGGPSVDASGNLYMATGNGSYDGVNNFANSIIKLSPTLSLLDWFTPANYASLDSQDLDMSSGRVMLLPGSNLLAVGEKDFNVYVVDRTCMGHLQGGGSSCASVVKFPTNSSGVTSNASGIYGGLFMNGVGYWPNVAGEIYAFSFSGGAFNTTPLATSASSFAYPGAQLAGSSNGSTNAILWGLTFASSAYNTQQSGTLRAFNPTTLAELWNSDAIPANNIGAATKFVAPTVANGSVFVPTVGNGVIAFGFVGGSSVSGQVTVSGGVTIH